MSARQSSAVDKALALIGQPRKQGGVHTRYSAAKEVGISLSTIYRALKRHQALPGSPRNDATAPVKG